MKCLDTLDEMYSFTCWICLGWITDDDVDHLTDGHASPGRSRSFLPIELFGLEPFDNFKRTVLVVRPNPGIEPFKRGLH